MNRKHLEEEHILFQDAVRSFIEKEVAPHYEQWEKDGQVSREIWKQAGELGMLSMEFPEEYGGANIKDVRFNAIVGEELARANATGPGFAIQNDIVVPYLMKYCTEEQKKKYLPGIASGEIIGALALSEPAAGSDLQGIKTTAAKKDNHFILNGSKTFISNGLMADLVLVFARTDPDKGAAGYSMLLLEEGMEGFKRGKKLDKIGLKGQDTAELYFEDVKVPFQNILGEEGQGFYYLMHNLPQERLSIAISAIANAEAALEWTLQYCSERKAFGKPIGSFQNTRFSLAQMKTELTIARVFVDDCILRLNSGDLTAEEAAMAKYWVSDLQFKVIDECLQLHGGYGYMNDFMIARAWRDCRVQRIYGGTNEIMKEIIGRSLGF
ncbi:acyl-CoA dehydrogenase domain-containing protein [Ochromonadaceae sp. CCMP2298]|nr:acyl-CoA dehydrogenase domain-containing protein [Ochromonadaceae sp. CCMP2298]